MIPLTEMIQNRTEQNNLISYLTQIKLEKAIKGYFTMEQV